ncbi:MAG: hypothetical protein IVW57_13920 [Ktedonobacterales bacterium]|nr:hypothetical protein [Ktedonobacterales bacterium]
MAAVLDGIAFLPFGLVLSLLSFTIMRVRLIIGVCLLSVGEAVLFLSGILQLALVTQ